MLILSRVCAEFRDRAGKPIFTISPSGLLSFLEAPEEIRQDPLFDMMLADGSLEAVQSVSHRKALESDPVGSTTAEGKKPSVNDPAAESGAAAPVKSTRKTARSAASASSGKAEKGAASAKPDPDAHAVDPDAPPEKEASSK